MPTYFSPTDSERKLSPAGLATVFALHGMVFWALLQMNIVSLPAPLAVLTVDLLQPPEVVKPPEPPVPPKPRPVEKRPVPVRPPEPVQLAAPAESPAPPTIAVPPAPTFVEPAPPAPPAPVQTIQPRFDADYLLNPKPVYPALSRRMNEEGRVVLRVQVRADGNAAEVQLHTSSGSPRLDQSALDTVRRWKFVPARRGDEAVAATVLVPIVFSLKE
ncbi:hypothetical protein MASR1M60_26060 [Rhodocyclaceae bacterium]